MPQAVSLILMLKGIILSRIFVSSATDERRLSNVSRVTGVGGSSGAAAAAGQTETEGPAPHERDAALQLKDPRPKKSRKVDQKVRKPNARINKIYYVIIMFFLITYLSLKESKVNGRSINIRKRIKKIVVA